MNATPRPDLSTVEDVEAMVRAFYRDAATDDLLGPVFAGMEVDWPTHIERMTAFWAEQLLARPGYKGRPLRAHEEVHARFPLGPDHHRRWLELFVSTVRSGYEGPVADLALRRGARMNRALERLLSDRHGPGAAPVEVALCR